MKYKNKSFSVTVTNPNYDKIFKKKKKTQTYNLGEGSLASDYEEVQKHDHPRNRTPEE